MVGAGVRHLSRGRNRNFASTRAPDYTADAGTGGAGSQARRVLRGAGAKDKARGTGRREFSIDITVNLYSEDSSCLLYRNLMSDVAYTHRHTRVITAVGDAECRL